MSILDRIRAYRGRDVDEKVESIAQTLTEKLDLRKQVFAAPATFNRKTRRSVGLLSKIWRWDMQVLGWTQPAPRYTRRHYNAEAFTHPKTRRQRRHRAQIMRLMVAR